jgi:hypothetical protein
VLWCNERYGIFENTPIQLVASLEAETRDVSKHFGHEPDKPEKVLAVMIVDAVTDRNSGGSQEATSAHLCPN